ncbi:L-glyceraldehyde 3-phosphate reductase [Clostridium sp. CF012]|uniref:L-glyceraldehyde 3-phosphate reductase n=1 Tax=Clostridium sp. CF012 TaxID=2843319 RepID=UPI001C0D471F|nr:L-glyceraldehyde 3-phosphate reductase [Clostridium sp. CF012]MBU3144252.1 L-glyceraldehyde 3-phosphate reductase [Clostridium sp. CF012]
MGYVASNSRYDKMIYNRCGSSGLKLPSISLGLWHNFGDNDSFENSRLLVQKAFDLGITHFDLANNYGPPEGAAEENFGRILKMDFAPYRDEIIVSTKAGYYMWPGPYGDWGSKKYLTASLDKSLQRMGLDYVDVFYHHRPDPNTPLEETMNTLDLMVRQGKALYIGLSNYKAEDTQRAVSILKRLGTPFVISQVSYSLLNRWIEEKLQQVLDAAGIGTIAFVPLAQGLLTNKYLKGIPLDSRAAGNSKFLSSKDITEEKLKKIYTLNDIAKERGQSLAQMGLSWVLRDGKVTSALIGASKVSQLEENIAALDNIEFTVEELKKIEEALI